MKPNRIEMIQTIHAGLPTVGAIAPMENSTSAGTPLATQNAPLQSILRCRLPTVWPACGTVSNVVASISVIPCQKNCRGQSEGQPIPRHSAGCVGIRFGGRASVSECFRSCRKTLCLAGGQRSSGIRCSNNLSGRSAAHPAFLRVVENRRHDLGIDALL